MHHSAALQRAANPLCSPTCPQVIALICHQLEAATRAGTRMQPALIACPASVMPNWASELARWAPGLCVVEYRGTAEERENIYYKQVRCRAAG